MTQERIQDSLDNLSQVKGRSLSPNNNNQKQKQYLFALKQRFVNQLAKLQSSETRQIASLEIKRIMDKNRDPQFIHMYLSVMKTLKMEGTTSSTKQHEILIFSCMSQIFKESLIDPSDKPSSKIKTVFKIIQMLHLYFTDPSNTVQQACARVLIDLGKNVLGTQKEGANIQAETVINLIFAPLVSILKNGVDKGSQATAALCINQIIHYWLIHSQNKLYLTLLKKVSPDIFSISLKLNCQYHDFFEALASLIELQGLQFFGQNLYQFMSKILGVINRLHKDNTKTNFNSYMCKVNVCLIIQKIGALIKGNQQLKRKLDELDIIPSLQKANRNRIIQVQMAAQKAIKVWNGEQLPVSLSKTPSKSNRGSVMSLQNARNDLKRKRSTSRQQKIQINKKLNHMQEDLEQMVKGGWGAHQRANNYVKKNSGVGGGGNGNFERSPEKKAGKSHKQEIEALRKYIKDNSKKYSPDSKFVFYEAPSKGNSKEQPKQQQNKRGKPTQHHKLKQNKENNEYESLDFQLQQEAGDQNAMMIGQQDQYQVRNPYAEYSQQQLQKQNKESVKVIGKSEKPTKKVAKKKVQSELSVSLHSSQLKQLEQREQELIEWGNSRMQSDPKLFEQHQRLLPFKKQKNQQRNNTPNGQQTISNRQLSFDQISNISSNMMDILNESDFRNIQKISFDQKTPHQQTSKNQSNVSLAISESKVHQKPIKQANQFTLNPGQPSKLNTFSNVNQMDEEVQEIEEMIYHEDQYASQQKNVRQSEDMVRKPGKSDIKDLHQKAVNHGLSINNIGKNRDSKFGEYGEKQVFQQMIKNPPRSVINHINDHPQNFRDLSSQQNSQQQMQQVQLDNITELWERILMLVEQQEYNQAFSLVFQMEDHIYLLRLMLITQVPLKKLTPTNVNKLWQKFLQIYKHRFIDQIFVQMFTTANQLQGSRGIKSCLNLEQTNDLLVELYELSGRSKGKLSFNAAVLYNDIDQSINTHR